MTTAMKSPPVPEGPDSEADADAEIETEDGSRQVNVRLPLPLATRLLTYCDKYQVSQASVVRAGLVRELDQRERR